MEKTFRHDKLSHEDLEQLLCDLKFDHGMHTEELMQIPREQVLVTLKYWLDDRKEAIKQLQFYRRPWWKRLFERPPEWN